MKIAVTYEAGNVFQHFGRTEQFKVYEVEEGKIVSAEVKGTNGVGHEALAGLLAEDAISVLICGGMGSGAQAALAQAGIEVYSGASGSADAAVETYLRGELVSSGVNCDHHDHHHAEDAETEEAEDEDVEEGCGGGCGSGGCGGGGCGGGGHCGGGCGGCGGGQPEIILEGPNAGKNVKVHYTGTLNDGTKFDSSYDRGEPLEFICGAGMMIRGFDQAVVEMKAGEIRQIHLMPEEAYGMPDPAAILKIEIERLPGSEALTVGQRVMLRNMYGQPFPVQVIAKDEKTITLDANHELAGKELNFTIELVEVSEE